MNSTSRSLGLALMLVLAGTVSLEAQRRTTDGGGSGGSRSTPGGGGGSRSGGSASSGRSAPGGGGSQSSASGYRDRSGASSGPSRSFAGEAPSRGKIGAIRDAATAARARARGGVTLGRGLFIGTCWGCDYWGWYGGAWGWYHGGWWYPAYYPVGYSTYGDYDHGDDTGYQSYPYAAGDSSPETFQTHHPRVRRGYATLSGQYFADDGSTTRAGTLALEGAIGALRGELEYGSYREPVSGGTTNHLQTFRAGIGGQGRIGNNAYVLGGFAARGLFLDDGSHAWGPEAELGLQLFPVRPFGANITGRLAGLEWNGSSDFFTLRELNTTGSLFVGRIELQAGWHWMRVGSSPAFGGPLLGMKLWF